MTILNPLDGAQAATWSPTLSFENTNTKDKVLVGEDATYSINISHDGGAGPQFNASVVMKVPNGVDYVGSPGLGNPIVYTEGTRLPNQANPTPQYVEEGYQVWVFENVMDLPQGAVYNANLTVRPDASIFPAGTADLVIDVDVYTSSNETLLPSFYGSTGVSTNNSHTSDPGNSLEQTVVTPVKVFKTEPSPEDELLRGVHNNPTTYTIEVEYTGEGDLSNVQVVDYLPAGLEYLGLGGIDNTEQSDSLYGASGTLEYSGAAPLTSIATIASDYAHETVETILLTQAEADELGLGDDAVGKVFTKVTWNLGQLLASDNGAVAQVFPNAAGNGGTVEIKYQAAVPLFENTMDWDNNGNGTPDTAGSQAANLNNNNGPSTRHGQGDDFEDAITYINAVKGSGTYSGAVADGTSSFAYDTDTENIDAVDVRILKGTHETTLRPDKLVEYTLTLNTSEYTSAKDFKIVDKYSNGLFPALPANAADADPVKFRVIYEDDSVTDHHTNEDWNNFFDALDMEYPYDGPSTPVLDGAVLSSLTYDKRDGSFSAEFIPTPNLMAADSTHEIRYTAFQRKLYSPVGSYMGEVSSGDRVHNEVRVEALSNGIAALEEVEQDTGKKVFSEEDLSEDSEATLFSQYSALSKRVLPRGSFTGVQDPSPEDLQTAFAASGTQQAAEPFVMGDRVFYQIRIEFAEEIDVRGAKLTDYLPQGVSYVDTQYLYNFPGFEGTDPVDTIIGGAPIQSGNVLTWELGYDSEYQKIVPKGSWIEFYIEGEVDGISESHTVIDKPQNLAKYQQQNSLGEVYFERDEAGITIDYGLTLIKGIQEVTDNDNNADSERNARSQASGDGINVMSNRDGIEVVHDEVVTYAIDIVAPHYVTEGIEVWDVLPVGIRAEDVDASSFASFLKASGDAADTYSPTTPQATAEVFNPGDAGYPNGSFGNRSVIVWTFAGELPASELEDASSDLVDESILRFTYDVVIPATGDRASQLTQEYTNTAGIISYHPVTNNPDANPKLYPDNGLSNDTPNEADNEFSVTGDQTRDDSNVYLPDASIEKALIWTEIDKPNDFNTADQIAQGELFTFEYSVEIPGRTTVADGVLKDQGQFIRSGNPAVVDYVQLKDVTFIFPDNVEQSLSESIGSATHTYAGSEFELIWVDGEIRFPETYTNTTDEPEVFTVQLTGYVNDRDYTNDTYSPDLQHNQDLVNTAEFGYTNPNDPNSPRLLTDDSTVQYVEPNVAITKSANPNTDVDASQEINYVIQVSNNNRTELYDATVVDVLPEGLLDPTNIVPSNGVWDAQERTITWVLTDTVPETQTFTYTTRIDPATAGQETYVNTVDVLGYTLPETIDGDDTTDRRGDRYAETSEEITSVGADIVKEVKLADEDDSEFAGNASGPVGDTVEYRVETMLKANINYYDAVITDTLPEGVELLSATIVGPHETSATGTVTGDWAYTAPTTGNTHTWTYQGAANDGSNDILTHDVDRTVELRYQVRLTSDIAQNVNNLPNTVEFNWNKTNNDPSTPGGVEDDATVTVLNPVLAINKLVDDVKSTSAEMAETFDYTVKVTNTGNTPAYFIVIKDAVPEGVIVDSSTISHGGVLTGNNATTGGGTITWQLDASDPETDVFAGPLYHGAASVDEALKSIDLSYTAKFANAPELDGSALQNIVSVEEFQSWDEDGEGRTYNPDNVTSEAEVNPLFPSLTVVKTRIGDELVYHEQPVQWNLTITNAPNTAVAYEVTLSDVLPDNWEYDSTVSVHVAGVDVTDATPAPTGVGTAADPLVWGVGESWTLNPGENIQIVIETHPTTDAEVGSSVVHTNTLIGDAKDSNGDSSYDGTNNPYVGPEDEAHAKIGSADLELVKVAIGDWTPGKVLSSDPTDRPQWQITVTNNGPDAAHGPFTITDVATYAEGVTQNGGLKTAAGAIVPEGADANTYVYGTESTQLPKDESFVFVIDVTVDSHATETSENAAGVESPTYDPNEDNNDDEAEKPLTPIADLGIEKTVSPDEPVAGQEITWTIKVTNFGPSVSEASATDPITITDQLPDGIDNVTAVWGDSNGDDTDISIADGVIKALITENLASGASTTIVVTATIDSDTTGTLENTAVVEPGKTSEGPNEEPNEDKVTSPVDSDTVLVVQKTLVPDNDADLTPGTTATYHLTVTNTGTADAVGVTITDNFPAGELSYGGSFENVTGTWSTSATQGATTAVFALAGPLKPGESRTVAVTADVSTAVEVGADVTNAVVAEADNAPPTPGDHTSGSQPEADLTIQKEAISFSPSLDGNPVAGGSVTYTVTVTNNGPSISPATEAEPITVTDTLPEGMSFDSLSNAGAWTLVSQDGQTVEFSFPQALDVDESVTFQIVANIADNVVPESGSIDLTNTVVVDGPYNSDPTNDSDDETITVVDSAVVTIVKTATEFNPEENGHAVAGGEVTYTLQVTNNGPSEARNVVVTDFVPEGFTITSMTGDNWITTSANTVRYDGKLAVGAAEVITVTGTIAPDYASGLDAGDTRDLTNTAEVTWTDGDGEHSDDDDETVEVGSSADLALTKTPNLDEAVAGEEIIYTIEVTNNGLSNADGPILVEDQIPVGTSFVRVESAGNEWTGGESADPSVLEFTRANGLAAGETAGSFDVVLLVDSAAYTDGIEELTNIATVSSPTPDPNPDNNTDDPTVPLNESADLEVQKTHMGTGLIDRDLQFGITVTNNGPSDARDVVVVDTLPVGLEYLDIEGSHSAWDVDVAENADGTTTVTLTLNGTLAADAQAPALVINTRVHVEAYPSVENTVTVDAETPDPEPSNNEDNDPVDVDPLVQLIIEKDSTGTFRVGETGTYVITVTNHGVTEDPGLIVVTDVLPEGLTFAGSDSEYVTATGQTVTYTHPETLGVDESFSFSFEVNVLQAAYPEVTNVASVDTPSELDPESILEDEVTNPVHEELADSGFGNLPAQILLALLLIGPGALLVGLGLRRRRRES